MDGYWRDSMKRTWTEQSALRVVNETCNVSDKIIKLNEDSTRGLTSCSAISYLCNHCGYKLI